MISNCSPHGSEQPIHGFRRGNKLLENASATAANIGYLGTLYLHTASLVVHGVYLSTIQQNKINVYLAEKSMPKPIDRYTNPRPPICTVSPTALTSSSHARATTPFRSPAPFSLRRTSSTAPPLLTPPPFPTRVRLKRRTNDSIGTTTNTNTYTRNFACDTPRVSAA